MNYENLNEEYYVENPLLNHLKHLGWQIYRQNTKNPEETLEIAQFDQKLNPIYGNSVKFRETFKEVILEEELKNSIKRINPWIEEDQTKEVIKKITTPQANSLLEANKEIHDLLLENTSVQENRQTGEKSPTVRFIDFKNPENNTFIAISQFKLNIPGTEKHIIPDIVLFVNGLPLVVIECKSSAISDPMSEAIKQLMRYSNRRGEKEGNERLFYYNAFMIATFRQKAKYGTITSSPEHFYEWKDPYPYSLSDIANITNKNPASQEILVQGMLSKNNLLSIIRNFILFVEDDKGGIKKIAPRYQQFRTVNKIIEKIKKGKTPEEKGGIVWHTQGSGKSLTMMQTVRAFYHDPELSKFKIVFITDREQLEKQLLDTSKSVGFTVHQAKNIEHFKELLKTNTPDLIMGMVHKFRESDLKKEFPVLNTSENILVMIDEAHRTQYKLLGANLRKALPNSVKIAFTGTPIEKTELTFGQYIDKYGIRQAIEDGVTVGIIYEGRTHSAELTDEEKANAKFEEVFKDADNEEKREILGKYTWRSYLEAQEVIKEKAKDMIEHYVNNIFPNGFKAQVVAVSRLAAVRYKEALEEALKEKIKQLEGDNPTKIDIETLKRLKVAVVISRGSNNEDPSIFKDEYTNPNEHQKNIKSFKTPFNKKDESGISGDVGIIVVNQMLLTGFDAPIEQAMYLDNVIKDHNLLQAIARVNRAYEGKNGGYVVDYVGVLKNLKDSLSIYADEDIEEISRTIINKAKIKDEAKHYQNKIDEFFNKNQISNWRDNVDDCIDLLEDKEKRNEFINLFRSFNRALDKLFPDKEALKYLPDLKLLSFIKESARNRYRDPNLSISDAPNKLRSIIEEHLISKGIDPKVPPTPILSDEFLEKLKKEETPKQRAKELEHAIYEHIEIHSQEDPEFYERFSERLKNILEQYKESWENLANELESLREQLKIGRASEETFGLDPKKEMPFLGLIKKELYGKKNIVELSDKEIDALIELTKDIISLIEKETKKVDFWDSEFKQRNLKGRIIDLLLEKENTFPNIYDKRNEITQKLLELAWNIHGKKN